MCENGRVAVGDCMRTGRLFAFLAIVSAACASFQRLPIPDWPRYHDGALAGFVEAPGEGPVEAVAGVVVRRVRGQILVNDENERDPLQVYRSRVLTPKAPFHAPGGEPGAAEKLVDGLVFVVELRPSGSGQNVRTLVARSGTFDFGAIPNGTYTLKATVLGWRAAISSITVSQTADADALIRIRLKPAAAADAYLDSSVKQKETPR